MKRTIVAAVVMLALALSACGSDGGKEKAASPPTKLASESAKDSTGTTAAEHDMAAMSEHDMADMAAVDDRGFSKLENGMEHGHAFPQAISKTDRVELARQLTLAREVALKYPTVADAEKAGLKRAGPFSPGLGAHYINYAGAGSNPDGKMTDAAIQQPLAWIYDGTHPDSHIAGLFYMTGVENAEGFAGPNDTWHVHHDICIKMAPDGHTDAPLGADHGATKAECDAVGGTLLKQTQYLLHVWVVPGYESPEGVFSHLSSTVTCDDGTYETIDDVTKIGDSTTVCKDGTE
jgi:hypothetical protein